MASYRICLLLFLCCVLDIIAGTPQQGRWSFAFNSEVRIVGVTKSVYNNTKLFLKMTCDKESEVDKTIYLSYVVRRLKCLSDVQGSNDTLIKYHRDPFKPLPDLFESDVMTLYKSPDLKFTCGHHIIIDTQENDNLKTVKFNISTTSKPKPAEIPETDQVLTKRSATPDNATTTTMSPEKTVQDVSRDAHSHPNFVLRMDGIYLITVSVWTDDPMMTYAAELDMELVGDNGYLSAKDWPLLPFYGVMCVVYVLYGIAWMVVTALQWRDLLRIQFWIGAVILLGMLESAVYYAEYQSVNATGRSVKGAMLFAEVVSCSKRALARMLVIIVSLGFGIVKPRLGPLLHRVVGVGVMYFILASIDSFLRLMETDQSTTQQMVLGQMPLAVLDAAICYWIFSSLVQTTRTLRLRRNIVKLSLYQHFTNTLIFVVVASVPFMMWSIKAYRMSDCITDWQELWLEQAYWPSLFAVVLLVIMVLWRPTQNNQRYAFSPLLDNSDDEEEDEDEIMANGAYEGMKIRPVRSNGNAQKDKEKSKLDEDLKWVDEHIPTSMADIALPALLDSDEEVMNTEFEISKMQ